MWQQILPGLRIKLLFTLLLGIVYPLVITGLCQVMFPHKANGSLVPVNGHLVGSELLGQNFTKPEYFHPRPSAAGSDGYDATSSAATNWGPTSQKLIDRTKASVDKFRKENPDFQGPLPADLLTASASGLDPDISPASADAQVARVAKARGVTTDQVTRVVAQITQGPDLGFLGEARVNVLKLNMELDRQFPRK